MNNHCSETKVKSIEVELTKADSSICLENLPLNDQFFPAIYPSVSHFVFINIYIYIYILKINEK